MKDENEWLGLVMAVFILPPSSFSIHPSLFYLTTPLRDDSMN